jgi:hypothetical protein
MPIATVSAADDALRLGEEEEEGLLAADDGEEVLLEAAPSAKRRVSLFNTVVYLLENIYIHTFIYTYIEYICTYILV